MKNDDTIIKLRKKIETKQLELAKNKVGSFSPKTTCIFELRGSQYNLHRYQSDELAIVLLDLKLLKKMADEESVKDLRLNSFPIEDLIYDCEQKLNQFQYKKERAKLSKMTDELNKLLSDDKRTELRLEELEKELS